MKTLEEIAKASHAAYLKESSRQGIPELMVLEFATDWSELDQRHQAAWIAATRQALAEAAIAPIPMPTEHVDVEHSIDTSETDARPFPAWGAP